VKLDNKKIKKRKGKGGCGLRGERDEKNKRKEKKRKVETGLEEGIDGRLSRSFVHAWFSFGCPLPLFFSPCHESKCKLCRCQPRVFGARVG